MGLGRVRSSLSLWLSEAGPEPRPRGLEVEQMSSQIPRLVGGKTNRPLFPAALAAILFSISLSAFFTACAGFGAKPPRPFSAPLDSRLIPGVPFIPDNSSHCGPSTLAAVLTYHGRPTTKEEVAVDVQREDIRGALGPDLVIWARQKGFEAGFKGSSPEEVLKSIDALKPVIILLDTGIGPIKKGHFVVAVGYNPDGLVVNSGEIQQELVPWSSILTSWYKLGNFAIFIEGEAGEKSANDPARSDGADSGESSDFTPPLTGQAWLDGASPTEAGELQNGSRGGPREGLPEDPRGESGARSGAARTPDGVEGMGGKLVVIESAYPVPAALAGADLPLDRPESKQPVISFVGRPPRSEAGLADMDAKAASEKSLENFGAPAGAGAGAPNSEAPLSEIVEESLGPPMVLPVVPLPEDDPLAPEAARAAAQKEREAAEKKAAAAKEAERKKEPAGPFDTGQVLGNPTPGGWIRSSEDAGEAKGQTAQAGQAQIAPEKAGDGKIQPPQGQAGQSQAGQPQASGAKPSDSDVADSGQTLANPEAFMDDPGYATITTSSGQVIGGQAPSDSGAAAGSGGKVAGAKAQAAASGVPTPPGVMTLSAFLTQSGIASAPPPPKEPVPVMGWERSD